MNDFFSKMQTIRESIIEELDNLELYIINAKSKEELNRLEHIKKKYYRNNLLTINLLKDLNLHDVKYAKKECKKGISINFDIPFEEDCDNLIDLIISE